MSPKKYIAAFFTTLRILARNQPAEKEKANLISQTGLYLMPATTYAPTHFRVQYHRPCGA